MMTAALSCITTCELGSEAKTACCAASLAWHARRGDIFCLIGDLGAGKSSFARAFIRALTTPDQVVPSPTFTIVQTYDVLVEGAFSTICHVDLYRINDPGEIMELGFEDALADGVMLVEWSDRVPGLFSGKRLEIMFSLCDNPDARLIELHGDPEWAERLTDCGVAEGL